MKLEELIIAVLISLLPVAVSAQTPQERHLRIHAAMQANNLSDAVKELELLRQLDPTVFTANNYDYLLGRLLEQVGNVVGSTASYQSVTERNSILSGYALWRLAQLARATGDLVTEREYLRQLLATTNPILVRESATMRLAESLYESGDYRAAISALAPLQAVTNRTVARAAQTMAAEALLKNDQAQEAYQLFKTILMQMPDAARPDDHALSAVRNLDRIDSENKSSNLTEAEHLLRASVYQFNRDFTAAQRHYAAVVASYPQSGAVPNALYQIGRGYYLQREYEPALEYFQRVFTEYPESLSARDALAFSAGSYNRLKRTDEAVAAYRRIIESYSDGPNPERNFLNIIDALHEAGRHKEALDWVQKARTMFRGQVGAAIALFAQTRIHLSQGDWNAVIADADELLKLPDLGGTRVPGGATKSEVTFLRAFALEQLGRAEAALSGYLSIPDGRNEYYGGLATQRLQAFAKESRTGKALQSRATGLLAEAKRSLAAGRAEQARQSAQDALRLTVEPAARKELLQVLRQAYDSLPAYKLPAFKLVSLGRQQVAQKADAQSVADELVFLGLYDEAMPELAVARTRTNSAHKTSADLDFTTAILFLRGGLANQAVRFAEQVWRSVPADYVLEVAPNDLIDLLYPLPFRDSLLKHASTKGVDPRLVISIARQESRFQTNAKSVAAARGLMQFIPSTADEIAAQLGMNPFRQDNLYIPDTAILFGSQYLANLFVEFPNQSEAVAASYNGGPDNMARWVARSRSNDPARYVSEIGFTQTKDYVFKIMTNYWIYQRLYDSQLQKQTQ